MSLRLVDAPEQLQLIAVRPAELEAATTSAYSPGVRRRSLLHAADVDDGRAVNGRQAPRVQHGPRASERLGVAGRDGHARAGWGINLARL